MFPLLSKFRSLVFISAQLDICFSWNLNKNNVHSLVVFHFLSRDATIDYHFGFLSCHIFAFLN